MKMLKTSLILLVAASGCTLGSNDVELNGDWNPKPAAQTEDTTTTQDLPTDTQLPTGNGGVCEPGKTWVGLGGVELSRDRAQAEIGFDRGRVKPYESLSGEYFRALGKTPALLSGMGPTFGVSANRWFSEPASSAITLYTAYRIAFAGCLDYTATPTRFGTAPNATTAETECIAMGEKFWSRTPTEDELASCVQVATQDTASETNARRKWAYTCASVLTSAGFLSY